MLEVLSCAGMPAGAPGGKPIAGSALKTPADHQPCAEYREKHRSSDRAAPAAQVRGCRVREDDAEQPGNDEVRTLHPAEGTVGEQADRVPNEVEAVAGEDLGGGGRDEQRTGDNPGEQCAAAYVSYGAVGGGG